MSRYQIGPKRLQQGTDLVESAEIPQGADWSAEVGERERLDASRAQRFYVRTATSGKYEWVMTLREYCRGKVTHMYLRAPDRL